ncbi:MAG: hypothetical protein U1E63_06465 [Burkholderiales bacterium]
MTRFSLALILMGLVFGPGYYALTLFFSGAKVLEQRLGEKGSRFSLQSGDVLHFSNANAFQPVEVDLDPGMNTVGLALVFDVVGDVRVEPVRGNTYRALLLANGTPLLQKEVTLSRGTNEGPDQHRWEQVASVDVPAAGKYVFVLQEMKSDLPVSGITLEVRRNVARPRMEFVWAGVLLLVGGVLAMLFGGRSGSPR